MAPVELPWNKPILVGIPWTSLKTNQRLGGTIQAQKGDGVMFREYEVL